MAPKSKGTKRRSGRVRSQSKRIAALDEDARDRMINKHLARLEEDNYKEEVAEKRNGNCKGELW